MIKVFNVSYGQTMGDCTCPYYITIIGNPILKDCLEQVLSSTGEWGSVKAQEKNDGYFDGVEIEYRRGDIVKGDFSEELLNRVVVSASGGGGYSNSDYSFKLK